MCTTSMGQVELWVAPRGGEVRLRDVEEGRTADGTDESVSGARGNGGMEVFILPLT